MTAKSATSENSNKLASHMWERLKEGSSDAMGQIYDLYIEDLFDYGMNQKQNRAHVMDSIHDVFLDLYKYRKNLAATDNVQFYLFKCLKRKIHEKKSWKIIPLQTEQSFSSKIWKKMASNSHEDVIMDLELSEEKNNRLLKAMNKLPKRQKECLLMRYAKDIPYEEIAKVMNVSVETARTIVYRGAQNLRKQSLAILLLLKITFF